MMSISPGLARVCGVLATLIAIAGSAQAGSIQTPAGLVKGDNFRIVFVTPGTIQATSASMQNYDSFVNLQAGNTTYGGNLISWQALGSTNSINAYDHIGIAPILGVYTVDGIKVASSTDTSVGGLWEGVPLLAPITKDQFGNSYAGNFVWTGTNGIGNVYEPVAGGKFGLGSTSNGGGYFPEFRTEVGLIGGTTGYDWIEVGGLGGVLPTTDLYQMYGISEVLTVVPEPSTLAIAGFGMVIVTLSRLKGKRLKKD